VGAFILAASLRVVVHECAHAVTLRVFGIPYRTEWLPLDDGRPLRSAAIGAVARVTPGAPLECSAWRLRTAAVAPLVLLAPFVLVRAGVLADPLADQPTVAMAAAGWLARAMPSPSDFSLSWHAGRAIDEHADRATRRHGLAGRVTR
jgi:hypothetical protein